MNRPSAKARAYELLSAMLKEGGDLGEMNDALPALTAFLSEFAAPDFVCRMVATDSVNELVFPGVEGLGEAWREWGEAFESVRAQLEEVLESDEHIVLLVKQMATTRHQGVEITQPSAMLWTFGIDGVRSVEFHLDQERALRRAGFA